MNWGNNMIMSGGNLTNMADTLKRIPFFFTFDLYLTEDHRILRHRFPGCQFPGISLCPDQNLQIGFNGPVGMNDWSFFFRQPVCKARGKEEPCRTSCWTSPGESARISMPRLCRSSLNNLGDGREKRAGPQQETYLWNRSTIASARTSSAKTTGWSGSRKTAA